MKIKVKFKDISLHEYDLTMKYRKHADSIGYMDLRIHILNDVMWFLYSGKHCIASIERPTSISKNFSILTNSLISDISLMRMTQLSLKVFQDFKNGNS